MATTLNGVSTTLNVVKKFKSLQTLANSVNKFDAAVVGVGGWSLLVTSCTLPEGIELQDNGKGLRVASAPAGGHYLGRKNDVLFISDEMPLNKDIKNGLSCGLALGASHENNGFPSARGARAARLDARTQLENSVIRECENVSVRDLSAKVCAFFAAPEWSGSAADVVRTSLEGMLSAGAINTEQYDSMWRAAAKNAGVDLSAPAVSVGRVLVVIRRNFLKEFVSLIGMSFNAVRETLRGSSSLGVYSWRLSCGAVRANSDINDFVLCSPLDVATASASAVFGALASLRVVSDFRVRLQCAKNEALNDFRVSLGSLIRSAKQLGFSDDEINNEIKEAKDYISSVDSSARKRLRNNIAAAVVRINECNDMILTLGGVGLLDVAGTPAKVCKAIKRALNDRSRAYSVVSTCEKVLNYA